MKKILIVIAVLILGLALFKKETITIPESSIRFRVIANSNSKEDQLIKRTVLNNLYSEINNINTNNLLETRFLLKKELPKLSNIVKNTIKDEEYHDKYNINYGNNYFPKKEYKNIVYPAGNYESLVVTLGEGRGDNFWCVLFPPLCLLEAEEEETETVEYTSLIKEIITKYFKIN